MHRVLGDHIFIYSILSWNEGQAGKENCARIAQESELATRRLFGGLPEDNSLVEPSC